MTPELILASASPRRRELLALTNIPFTVDAPDVDETCDLPAGEAVAEIARRKAVAAAQAHPGCVILAADTLVFADGEPLGKPKDREDAFRMLCLLRDREHTVCTGVCCVDAAGGLHRAVNRNTVCFGPMTDEEIRRYIATGEPMDKAGAYALQGMAGLWITRVTGSPSGVIGLPLDTVRRLLAECGLTVLP